MNYFDKQVRLAKENYNYFFVKLIFSVLKILFKLSIFLIFSSIFNLTIIYIISLIYVIYSLYNIFTTILYYYDIINDIKNTLGYDELCFEIDFNLIRGDILRGMLKYGK